jgi:uncharacterized protein (TIGR03086 family)
MDELQVLRTAYARTSENVEALSPEDLSRPTPCSEWDVRALLAHVVAATDGLTAMLHDETPDWGKDALGDDPGAAVRRSYEDSLAAWAEPGAVGKPSTQMPGMRVVDFALGDAVAHAWDLATALGRPLDLPDEVVQAVLDRWQGEPASIGRQYGAFGPAVEVPTDAPALHRLLGEMGRDPSAGAG